jgi:Tol biopolymer transport system component
LDDTPVSAATSDDSVEDRLDSWKEIAAYLNRDVTTVQRWEKREAMPVHRHLHDRLGSVYAFRSELNAWVRTRKLATSQPIVDEIGQPEFLPDATQAAPLPDTGSAPPQPANQTTSAQPLGGEGHSLKWFHAVALLALAVVLMLGLLLWRKGTESFSNPVADARFQVLADFDGVAQAAAISRDGSFVAFLSDRDGHMDVWVTQLGSGQFRNLTQGSFRDISNAEIRCLGFSPDGALVSFWVRRQEGEAASRIGIWGVPTMGGAPRPYLDGVAEFEWSQDGKRLTYHTPLAGDPLFVTEWWPRADARSIYTAAAGMHSHFPTWAPDGSYVYFVYGSLPDKLDLWRIRPSGGTPEQITKHESRVTYPVWVDGRLLYLASDPGGGGPWLYGVDTKQRQSHRLTSGIDRYTSLAASQDGRKLVATLARAKKTLWRVPFFSTGAQGKPAPIPTDSGSAFAPRAAGDSLIYVSTNANQETLWRLAAGKAAELWSTQSGEILGAPAISKDAKWIAFCVREGGRSSLYRMRVDGGDLHVLTDALDLQGAPTWTADARFVTVAANDQGTPHLYQVPVDGTTVLPFVKVHALDPTWSPDGTFAVYSGPDIGTTFELKAATPDGAPRAIAPLVLTRGARHVVFLHGAETLLVLRGDMQHKDLWAVDLTTGASRQLTHFAPDFLISDFEVAANGQELIVERQQERSELVLIEVAGR